MAGKGKLEIMNQSIDAAVTCGYRKVHPFRLIVSGDESDIAVYQRLCKELVQERRIPVFELSSTLGETCLFIVAPALKNLVGILNFVDLVSNENGLYAVLSTKRQQGPTHFVSHEISNTTVHVDLN
jgi:hypothetical protein